MAKIVEEESGGPNNDDEIDQPPGQLEERSLIIDQQGNQYKGQWYKDQKQGHGKQTWPDGAKYTGQWKNNKANGIGIF